MKDTNKSNIIICRCSDLSLQKIEDLIAQGYCTFEEIKRISRLGMGPCQGRTCIHIVLREISRITGTPISELIPGTYRPPIKPIKIGMIAEATLKEGYDD